MATRSRPVSRTIKIVRLKVQPNFTLLLKLSNGRKVERSFAALAERAPGVMRVIRRRFDEVKIVHGALTWPGEVDLCPLNVIYGPNWLTSRRVPAYLEF
jgi:hypothetical protein